MFRERNTRVGYRSKPNPEPTAPAKVAPPTPVFAPVAVPPPALDPQWEADRANPLRQKLFYFALAAIFIRFSVIHEALADVFGLNLYLLYLVMPPTILGFVATGGIRRTLQARSAKFWVAFLIWISIATVFSSWRGGSFGEVSAYAKAEFIMLFAIAGMVVTWREFKLVLYVLSAAALSDVVIGRLFMKQDMNRIDLAMGASTISNANDLAAHLILMNAFLIYILIAPKIPGILRLVSIPAICYCLYMVVSTGSRGAVIALIVCTLFSFMLASSQVRIGLLIAAPVAVLMVGALLPRATLLRLSTLGSASASSEGDSDLIAEAEASAEARQALLKKSIEYTFQHPLFGVGPAQFTNYEGGESTRQGHRGMWHQTHNMFTQVSSECGIPALIFFIGAIGSAFGMAYKIFRRARSNPANADISIAAFCLMLGIVGFLSAAFFLNLGYRFYEPAFCGLCIVLYSAASHEMAVRQTKAASTAAAVASPLQPIRPFGPAPAFRR